MKYRNEKEITVTLTRLELCDLALACVGAKHRANDGGAKWERLREMLHAIIDASDAADDAAEAVTLAPANAACVWTEDGENVDPTDTTKEDNTMTANERYDYLEHMTADIIEAIRDNYTDDEIRARLDDDRDEFAQDLNDDLWIDDSVTGNGSGSYYCNAWRAEEAIAHNWDLIADMIDEFDAADILRKGPEAIDVSIRCYLLYQAIDAALDQLDEDIPEAEEIDEDGDTNDADAISA